MSDFQRLSDKARAFAEARDWDKFHSPKNLTMALGGEVSELLDLFQWLTEAQLQGLPLEGAEAAAAPVRAAALRTVDVVLLLEGVEGHVGPPVPREGRLAVLLLRYLAVEPREQPHEDRLVRPPSLHRLLVPATELRGGAHVRHELASEEDLERKKAGYSVPDIAFVLRSLL